MKSLKLNDKQNKTNILLISWNPRDMMNYIFFCSYLKKEKSWETNVYKKMECNMIWCMIWLPMLKFAECFNQYRFKSRYPCFWWSQAVLMCVLIFFFFFYIYQMNYQLNKTRKKWCNIKIKIFFFSFWKLQFQMQTFFV